MAGRDLGDELRYILDREYAKKYPGNMLERPSLLLNAWPMRGTETTTQHAAAGTDFAPAAKEPSAAAAARGADAQTLLSQGLADFANLDFLPESTVLVANLRPDDEGHIIVPLADLGQHQHIHVVAVDPLTTVYRSTALPKTSMPFQDLRLKKGLEEAGYQEAEIRQAFGF